MDFYICINDGDVEDLIKSFVLIFKLSFGCATEIFNFLFIPRLPT